MEHWEVGVRRRLGRRIMGLEDWLVSGSGQLD